MPIRTALRVSLLATLLAFAAPAAFAQDADQRPIEQRMSAEEFAAAGLEKLSPAELAALNDWLRGTLKVETERAAAVAAEAAAEQVAAALMDRIAHESMAAYRALIDHPDFWDWYVGATPIEAAVRQTLDHAILAGLLEGGAARRTLRWRLDRLLRVSGDELLDVRDDIVAARDQDMAPRIAGAGLRGSSAPARTASSVSVIVCCCGSIACDAFTTSKLMLFVPELIQYCPPRAAYVVVPGVLVAGAGAWVLSRNTGGEDSVDVGTEAGPLADGSPVAAQRLPVAARAALLLGLGAATCGVQAASLRIDAMLDMAGRTVGQGDVGRPIFAAG